MQTDKIKISMFHLSYSGSNNFHLYHAAPDEIKQKYTIELLTKEQAEGNRYLDDSDVYITTHGEYFSKFDKINVDLWHGFPLKGIAKMDPQEKLEDEEIHHHWSKVDLVMSYSAMYNTALNACNGSNISKYRITGMPRNDALFDEGSRNNLKRLYPALKEQDHVIFFMPTFRRSINTPDKHEGNKLMDNLFGLPDYDRDALLGFLEQHRITLVVKLHPFEESYYVEELDKLQSGRIFVLNDAMLADTNLDLYHVLGSADQLLTDYSSVYIDYLLVDRPVVFLPTDLEAYKETRGFLFEPYDFWAPGPKVLTQSDMLAAIHRFMLEPTWYGKERETIRNICHYYQDRSASARIWSVLDNYIQDNLELIYKRREEQEQCIWNRRQQKQSIQMLLERNQLLKANDALQQYLQINPVDSDIFAMYGMMYLLNGNADEAIRTFTRGITHFPWDEDLFYNLGYVHETQGNLQQARDNYQKALRLSTKPELTLLLQNKLASLPDSEGSSI